MIERSRRLRNALRYPLDHADRRIASVAADQDGVITFDQLRALGVGRGAIESRRARGLLCGLHVGVYRAGPLQTPRTRIRAAVLACCHDALASHHAALALYGIRSLPGGRVDVTTVERHVGGCGRACTDRLVSRQELAAVVERAPRRPGVVALRQLVEQPPAFTRSRAERMLVALLRAAQLPEPLFNAVVEGYEVDALWQQQRVILEFDSYAFHATRGAVERDRSRTARLTRARHLVLRTTWNELTKQPYALVARVAEALSAGVPTASPARAGP